MIVLGNESYLMDCTKSKKYVERDNVEITTKDDEVITGCIILISTNGVYGESIHINENSVTSSIINVLVEDIKTIKRIN